MFFYVSLRHIFEELETMNYHEQMLVICHFVSHLSLQSYNRRVNCLQFVSTIKNEIQSLHH